MNIKEAAQAFKPLTTRNISELDVVATNLEVHEEQRTNKEGEAFTLRYIEVGGEKYRVPMSVISALQAILQKEPNLQWFTVVKQGAGMETKYIVVPKSGPAEIQHQTVQ